MENGPARRLMLIEGSDLDVTMEIGSDISVDGKKVGSVTSVAKGYTVGKMLAQGYVQAEFAQDGLAVVVRGKTGASPAVLRRDAVYNAERSRVRS